jgi:RNA recognition motif-containing protein
VNVDSDGRSLGTGVIAFTTRADAVKFLKEYDGVDLDGQPIKLELSSK